MNSLDNLVIPEFKECDLNPRNKFCLTIDTTRLLVEVLWWLDFSSEEFLNSSYSNKIILEWKYSLVIRYKRETDWKYHPACVLSFDEDEKWNININNFSGSKDKRVAYRFFSSFDSIKYFIKLIEESFLKKWIYVWIEDFPTWIEGASYSSNAHSNYELLRKTIKSLNFKYNNIKK